MELNAESPKLLTLTLPLRGDTILLGKKLRGFGKGFYNGFGGKVEQTETIVQAAIRELEEECCLLAAEADMCPMGILTFFWLDEQTPPWEVHIFTVEEWLGEPRRTDEMDPAWFHRHELPWDIMWPDDPHWYPYIFSHTKFAGRFYFTNTTTLVKYQIREIDDDDDVEEALHRTTVHHTSKINR